MDLLAAGPRRRGGLCSLKAMLISKADSHPRLTTVSSEGDPLKLRPVVGQVELSD